MLHLLFVLALVPFALVGAAVCFALAVAIGEATWNILGFVLMAVCEMHPHQRRKTALRAEQAAIRRAAWRAKPRSDKFYVFLSFAMLFGLPTPPLILADALHNFGLVWSDAPLYAVSVASVMLVLAWIVMTLARISRAAQRAVRALAA